MATPRRNWEGAGRAPTDEPIGDRCPAALAPMECGLVPAGGFVDGRFGPVREAFDRELVQRGDRSAAVAVYWEGRPVVDLWGGSEYQQDTLQFLFSSTKGVTAICLALLEQRGLLDPAAPVATYWPEFGEAGKSEIPVRWLLSHQAGVPTVDGGFGLDEIIRHDPLARQLEAQWPYWEPGTAHGYHSITLGPLAQELVKRITGCSIGRFFATEIAGPYQVDVHIGLATSDWHRVCATRPAQTLDLGQYEAGGIAAPAGSLAAKVLSFGLDAPRFVEVANDRRGWIAGIPSLNALGRAPGPPPPDVPCVGARERPPP